METMIALIVMIAVEVGIPPNFALAVALTENTSLNPTARGGPNKDGTYDLGIMQLNSRYYGDIDWRDPETNIRAGCIHIRELIKRPETSTWWSVALAYNCGIGRITDPPTSSISYANAVNLKYNQYNMSLRRN